jgi:hypothetical protein
MGQLVAQGKELAVTQVVSGQQITFSDPAPVEGGYDAPAYIIYVHDVLATGWKEKEALVYAQQQQSSGTGFDVPGAQHESGVHHHGRQLVQTGLIQYELLGLVFGNDIRCQGDR